MKKIIEAVASLFVDTVEYDAWEWESEREREQFIKYFRWAN
jgi:hypothetical protein